MKKIVFILFTLLVNFTNVSGARMTSLCNIQTDRTEEKINKMDEIVALTPEQKVKYKALIEKSEKEQIQLKEKLKGKSLDEQKKVKNEFKSNYEKELKAILTSAQWTKLNAAKDKSKNQN